MLYVAQDDRGPVLPLPSCSWDYRYARVKADGFQFSQTGLTLWTRLAWNSLIFLRALETGTWYHYNPPLASFLSYLLPTSLFPFCQCFSDVLFSVS